MQKKPRRTFYEWMVSQSVLRDDVIKIIFDHVRNIGLSGLVLGSAFYWMQNPTNDPGWLRTNSILFMFLGGLMLFLFNFFHGLKKLGDAGVPSKLLVILGLAAYIPMIGFLTQLFARE